MSFFNLAGWVSLLLLQALAAPTHAAEAGDGPSLPPPRASTEGSGSDFAFEKLQLTAGPGLAIYGGTYSGLYDSGRLGVAFNVGVMGQLPDRPIFVGVDFGMDFWGFKDAANPTHDLSATGIQLLPSAIYRFEIPNSLSLHPYIGLSVGPHFLIFKKRVADAARTALQTDTSLSAYLEILVRPGVNYQLTDEIAVNFEPKLGVLNWDFIFLPSLNLSVSL